MTNQDSIERQPREGRSMPPQDQILGLVNNYWQATCAGAAAQLQIADPLAEGPLHVDVLAERTKTHASSLFRMLRALECTGIFAQTSPRVFTNTPLSECLRHNVPGSQCAWIRICLCSDSAVFDGWSGLTKALLSGRTGFEEVRGCLPWEYLQARPEQQSNFNAAMRDLSAAMTPAVAAAYDWSRFPVIADIGGGIGAQQKESSKPTLPAVGSCSISRTSSRKLCRQSVNAS